MLDVLLKRRYLVALENVSTGPAVSRYRLEADRELVFSSICATTTTTTTAVEQLYDAA